RIADLVRGGQLDGISDLRDESDRQGLRIVIELKQGVEMEETLRGLYHRTPLQTTFGITLLALVDGEPRLLNLKQALRVFLEHRQTVVKRRSEFDLARAKHREHILEGLRVALKNLDEVISLIRSAPDVDQARARLMKRFKLSEIQAQAILDMQLRRLASLERKKIDEEYKEVTALIKELETLLHSPKRMREVVGEELQGIKQTYGDRRRTQIFALKEGDTARSLLTTTDFTTAQSVWVGVTADGKIGRLIGEALPDVMPRHLLRVSTHETLYLASTQGLVAAVAVHVLPEVTAFESGAPLYKACALEPEDKLAFMLHLPEASTEGEQYVLTCTRQGMIKKSAVTDLPGPSAQRFVLVKVNNDDELLSAMVTDGTSEIMMISAQGMGIRFSEEEVRPMGLVAAGVMGIKLGEGDQVAAMLPWAERSEVFILASDGSGWRMSAKDFPKQGRYGQGVIACRVAKGAELVGAAIGGGKTGLLAILSRSGIRRLRFSDAALVRRTGKSSVLWKVKAGDEPIGLVALDLSAGANSNGSGGARKKPSAEAAEVKKTESAARSAPKPAKATEAVAPGRRKNAAPAASRTKAPATRKKAATAPAARKAAEPAPAKTTRTKAAPTPAASAAPASARPSAAKTGRATTGPKAAPPEKKPRATKTPAKASESEQPAAGKRKTTSTQPSTKPIPAAKPATRKKPSSPPSGEQQLLPGLDDEKPKPRRGNTTK
nr:DNA gyrase subunit A [Anaerolinea sp.]